MTKRIVIVDPTSGRHTDALRVLVNPTITVVSPEVTVGPEGCLSLPGMRLNIPRYDMVTIEYKDVTGRQVVEEFNGFVARICQHEIDHLDGRMFIDRISAKQRKRVLKALSTGDNR